MDYIKEFDDLLQDESKSDGELLSIARDYIAELQGKCLASPIQKLEDALKKSSAPKENEDGTVEFHINGKTYVGTVKEE